MSFFFLNYSVIQILTTEDDNALVARVVLNNLEGESQDPDIDVDVRMGGTKIVFVNWFVTNLLVNLLLYPPDTIKILVLSLTELPESVPSGTASDNGSVSVSGPKG